MAGAIRVYDMDVGSVKIDVTTRVPGERPQHITAFEALMNKRDKHKIGDAQWQAVNKQLEIAIGQVFNAPLIQEAPGKGFQADVNISPAAARAAAAKYTKRPSLAKVIDASLERTETEKDEGLRPTDSILSEIKAITPTWTGGMDAPRVSEDIKLAGEKTGVSLYEGQEQTFTTVTGEERTMSAEEMTTLVADLRAVIKNDRSTLINIIESNPIILSNIMTKGGRIKIPYRPPTGGVLLFNWSHVKKFGRITVGRKDNPNAIGLNVWYPAKFVSSLLSITEKGAALYTDELRHPAGKFKSDAFDLIWVGKNLERSRPFVEIDYLAGSINVANVKNLITGTALASTLKKTPKRRRKKKSQQPRGKFVSNVQLSAILQKRLTENMPRYPEPHRPTPRYITGQLARSFQIMANYRQGIIGFYNTPPAAGYVDELNENGWMLDKTLVEPTIRQITQQLFGRQFRVLRTQ